MSPVILAVYTKPMRTVSITEFRADLSRILNEAERGAVYRITRGGVPIARIEPFAEDDRRELDAARRAGASRAWPFLVAGAREETKP